MWKSSILTFLLFAGCVAQNCVLTIPAPTPLSKAGLESIYFQTGCTQAGGTPSFVQGAILDPTTGRILIYNPLVVDQGATAAAPPAIIPIGAFPQGAIVGLWFGTNGDTLALADNGGSLTAGNCINGAVDPFTGIISNFGQFAHCNAIPFFTVALNLLQGGLIIPPPLGVAFDGAPCPTIRDFFIVDQDPSDNVNTVYIVAPNGLVAQNTTANILQFNPTTFLQNGSDNKLLVSVDMAIGCQPYRALDIADTQNNVPAVPLNELHAVKWQQNPIALIPLGDPMCVVTNGPNLKKVNAYRQAVGQPVAATNKDANTVDFCFGLYLTFPLRLLKLTPFLINGASPDPMTANNLMNFLGFRFVKAFGIDNLNCFDLLRIPAALPPIRVNVVGGVNLQTIVTPPNNGPNNPIYAATTGNAVITPAAKAKTIAGLPTNTLIAIVVGCGIGFLTIVGFIIAFRAHRVRNFCSGVRDGIATKMRD